MGRIGNTYRCAGCGREGVFGDDLDEQYDRYNIYAGMFHEQCWRESGIRSWTFDPADAGESLEEEY